MTASKSLSLYRSILRAHSKFLPSGMRDLGDKYVKAEFRQHKNVTNEDHLKRFFQEWEQYLSHIGQAARARESRAFGLSGNESTSNSGVSESEDSSSKLYSFGADLETGIELTDEQKSQLEKLREEASSVHSK